MKTMVNQKSMLSKVNHQLTLRLSYALWTVSRSNSMRVLPVVHGLYCVPCTTGVT